VAGARGCLDAEGAIGLLGDGELPHVVTLASQPTPRSWPVCPHPPPPRRLLLTWLPGRSRIHVQLMLPVTTQEVMPMSWRAQSEPTTRRRRGSFFSAT
jgi:hypothetical protein